MMMEEIDLFQDEFVINECAYITHLGDKENKTLEY